MVELARSHTVEAIKVLYAIATGKKHAAAARVRAAELLLERGWGSVPATLNLQGEVVHRVKRIILLDHQPTADDMRQPQAALPAPAMGLPMLPPADDDDDLPEPLPGPPLISLASAQNARHDDGR